GRREENGRYCFIDDYRLPGTSTPDAALVAGLIAAMIKNVDVEYTKIADNLLKGRHFSTPGFLFQLDLEDISSVEDLFRLLNQAVALHQKVGFSYTNNQNESKDYTVHPYRLANLKGFWYLLAYDLNEGRLKSFYLKKITALIIHPSNYRIDSRVVEVLENFSDKIFSPWICEDCKNVKLKISGPARLYLERNLPAALTVESEDFETLLVSMQYYSDHEVLALVKQWLPDIMIIENQPLISQLQVELDRYRRQCDSNGV
ncbi:WYL domain-containing protein, partial [bacterium]|nr:WYL domain-containing protein [bacterium]